MSYSVLFWVHVLSYITWLVAFAFSLYYAYKVGKSYNSPSEKRFMQLERRATSIGAHIGALGILISGGAMVSIPGGQQFGWFNFDNFAWLAVKQVVFFLILILVGFSIKRGIDFKKQLRSEEGEIPGEDVRKKWKRAYDLSMAVYALVILNTFLGLYNTAQIFKPL